MKDKPLISVILPVFNRMKYIEKAVNSVLNQTYDCWELIISDDASKKETYDLLLKYDTYPYIKINRNLNNLGLFANLNQAIKISKGEYIIILCSDDYFLPNCLEDSLSLLKENSQSNLLLTPFYAVDSNESILQSQTIKEFEQYISNENQVLQPYESVPLLLKFGSINGNITRLFFSRKLFDEVGGFEESWFHAGDWEWLYRAMNHSPVLISKTPLATIRLHKEQLSGVNFKNTRNSLEVIKMVRTLLNDRYISKLESAKTWALRIMQFHLWYAIKFAIRGKWKEAFAIVRAIDKVTGFTQTFWAMVQWLPERWRVDQQKKAFMLPK